MTRKRPTILQIIPNLDTGGAEISTVEITEAVVRHGGRALTLSEGGRLVAKLRAAGGEFIPFPAATKNPARLFWNARRIARLIVREGVDLVHARSRAPAWSALIAARRTGRPFVTTYHGAYNEANAIKRAYNSVMARGDIVIANSGYTAELIKRRYATPSDRIRIIHRGVDIDAFDPSQIPAKRVERLRARWGLSPTDRVVLHAARLSGWKGQRIVIDAARDVLGAVRDVVFILAGDAQGRDGYVAELNQRIADADLDTRVRIVGHCDDMPAAYRCSQVTLVASTDPEAFGRAATEAQAMGCPVIATRIGAPSETVLAEPTNPRGDRTGWLVPPGNVAALAAALTEALTLDPSERSGMSTRAQRHIRANFSLDTMQRKTLTVYDELLGTVLSAGADGAKPPGNVG